MSIAVGARVLHDGHEDFKVNELVEAKGTVIAVFENLGYRVKCNAAELVELKEENAWYLPGRLLSREQRRRFSEIVGSSTPPGDHVAARKILQAAEVEG